MARQNIKFQWVLMAFAGTIVAGCDVPTSHVVVRHILNVDPGPAASVYTGVVTPITEPVQIRYRAFAPLSYSGVLTNADGVVTGAESFTVGGQNVHGRIALTMKYRTGRDDYVDRGFGGPAPVLRALIDQSGNQLDAVGRSNRGIIAGESADKFGKLTDTFAFPIYQPSPVAMGQMIAQTVTLSGTNMDVHWTFRLSGRVICKGKQAFLLDLDHTIVENSHVTDYSVVLRAQGYLIVDPANGTVLEARFIAGAGGGETLQRVP